MSALQVGTGGLMDKLRPIFGSKLIKWHIRQGAAAFVLALAHPALLSWELGPEAIIKMGGEAVWGKIALNLLVISVLAGWLRGSGFMARYWRWIHRLNYVILALVWWHSWQLGTDARTWPMAGVYILAPAVLILSLTSKIRGFRIAAYGHR